MASSQSAPLERIFVIRHAMADTARRMPQAEACRALLTRSFPPYWDPAAMEFTLALLDEVTRTTPCYDLGFLPKADIVNFVRHLTDK